MFVNSGVLHGCRQLTGGSRLFTFGMTPAFFSSPMFGKLYQNIIVPVTHCPVRGAFFPGAFPENRPLLRLFAQFEKLSPRQEDYELHTFELVCRIWRALLKRLDWKTPDDLASTPRQGQLIALSEMVKFIQEHYREPICVDDMPRPLGSAAGSASAALRSCGERAPRFSSPSTGSLSQPHSWRLRASPSLP